MGPPHGTPHSRKAEIVIGLVGAAGAKLSDATDAVKSALAPFGYDVVPIRLSELMHAVEGGESLAEIGHEDERIWAHMDSGDAIRNQTGRNDAIAGLAVGYISDYRKDAHAGAPSSETAFLLDSLKHPAEVEAMRNIYRDRFVLISVHAPTDARLAVLKQRIAVSHGAPERDDTFAVAAEKIMRRDEHDDDRGFGQNVREAFTRADVYVSTQPEPELENGISRYFRLFFGDPFITPTPAEYAMFQTHAAALRSADLSRQVGATICTSDGEIIAVGCNEVPKAHGGQYWPGDEPDGRDFQLRYDSNAKYRDEALEDAFTRLQEVEGLAEGIDLPAFMLAVSRTRLANLTEFGRTVHAEMAALLDAARRGVSVAGHQLFSTTFPCHNCARHIVGAGVREVVYREPYEKSLAGALHPDAIAVDPADDVENKVVIRRFVGVGPPRYLDLFTMTRRKDSSGNRIDWTEATAAPRLVKTETAYLTNEEDFLDEFRGAIELVDLSKEESDG